MLPAVATPESARPALEIPHEQSSPAALIGRRLGLSVLMVLLVALLAYLGRDGYVDAKGDGVSFLDALYYSTVSVTTTGYGDVRPETDTARLVTTIVITPIRILFLILLVGTTLELLAERTREAIRLQRRRRHMQQHVIICGFGTKGRSAARTMLARGTRPEQVVVVDDDPEARIEAQVQGFATVAGSATTMAALEQAGIREAAAVVVAPHRDDTSVLITLTARELNPTAMIVSAVREEENVHLLHQSGANSVITSSGAAGRLLGLATHTPLLVEVLEDLLSVGEGLDLIEREVAPEEVGPLESMPGVAPIVAVLRGGRVLRFDDPEAAQLQAGDRVVCLCSHAA